MSAIRRFNPFVDGSGTCLPLSVILSLRSHSKHQHSIVSGKGEASGQQTDHNDFSGSSGRSGSMRMDVEQQAVSVYTLSMQIVWDERKRHANLHKHGLDFEDLTLAFFLDSAIKDAKHGRFQAIGRLQDGTLSVIFAALGREAIAVISMRPASDRERRLFDATEI